MEISQKDIEDTITRFYRRCEAARSAGGISRRAFLEGATIPDGWRFDYEMDYWLPPEIAIF